MRIELNQLDELKDTWKNLDNIVDGVTEPKDNELYQQINPQLKEAILEQIKNQL